MERWAEKLQGYLCLDIEASGVHARSYPIEIGWCGTNLIADSFLIHPHERWGEEDWSLTSERIHNIPRPMLFSQGIDVVEAAHRLNSVCRGREVITDNPFFDGAWLTELFHVADIRQEFTLGDATQIEALAAFLSGLDGGEAQAILERVKIHYPHPHRAAPDARRCAARLLVLCCPDQIEEIIAMA